MVLSNVGKFGVSACFALVYLYSAEIFPTVVRNSAIAFCAIMARVGGMVAPHMAALVRIYRQTSNIRSTKSQRLDVLRLVLKLSLPNPLNPGAKSRMEI